MEGIVVCAWTLANKNANLESFSILKEKGEFIMSSDMQTKLTDSVREWYHEAFPNDSLWDDIPEETTFGSVTQTLLDRKDVYAVIAADSFVRENVFSKLSDILEVDYDDVYYTWLSSSSVMPDAELAAHEAAAREHLATAKTKTEENHQQIGGLLEEAQDVAQDIVERTPFQPPQTFAAIRQAAIDSAKETQAIRARTVELYDDEKPLQDSSRENR